MSATESIPTTPMAQHPTLVRAEGKMTAKQTGANVTIKKTRGAINPILQRQIFWSRMPAASSLIEHCDEAEPDHVGINVAQENFEIIDPFGVFLKRLTTNGGRIFSLTAPFQWPESTNLWCMNCVHPFSGRPLMSPTHYHDEDYSFSGCIGVFCSLPCVARWIMTTCSLSDKDTRLFYLHIFAERVFNICDAIVPSPLQNQLYCFGGKMTLEQFRSASNNLNREYEWIKVPRYLPDSHLVRIIEAQYRNTMEQANSVNMMDTSGV